MPLSRLGRYRNVVWILDPDAAIRDDNAGGSSVTALYAMSRPGYQSMLATYTQMGGRVWLFGGGCAYASLSPYDKAKNNRPSTTFFSSLEGELASPTVMCDAMHWQSTIAVLKTSAQIERSASALRIAQAPWQHADFRTGSTLRAPDYLRLPATLRLKAPDTDPLPPTRAADRGNLFYVNGTALEVLAQANSITEDVDPSEDVARVVSTLDTLHDASGGFLPAPHLPVMTYYHGPQARQAVFSGAPLWLFTRTDTQALIDFVLQNVWGLTRTQRPPASTLRAAGASRPAGRVRH